MHFILKTIIGREEEQAALVRLLGQVYFALTWSVTLQNNPVAPCIVVNGPPGCGKSLLLSSTLADLELINGQRWVLVSCLEGFSSLTSTAPSPSSRFLFELVLRSIQSRYGSISTVHSRCCDNPVKFLDALCELMRVITSERPNFSIASLVLVFDQAEKLRDADPFLLPLLVRLGPLVEEQLRREDSISCNVRLLTILVTHSLWEKFSSGTFHLEPVLLTLHNYSRDEMMRILLSIKPEAASEERYHRFLDLLLTICFPVCRSIFELIHLSKVNWPAFEEPIVKGMVSPDDEWGQWKLAQPTLKRSLSTLYLRSLAVPHWGLSVKFSGSELEPARVAPNLELPYYARFLLIAAFLASFNPRESDRKFFAKNIGKQTTRMKRKEKTAERTNALLTGPRLFPLDRMLVIFHALIRNESEPAPRTALLTSQIACLTALGLLATTSQFTAVGGLYTSSCTVDSTCLSDTDPLANPKYRCLLNLDTAKAIARTIDFDLPAYLVDLCGVC